MAHRFQTRIAFSVILVIALTVAGMTLLLVLFAAKDVVKQDRERAVLLHRLLQNSIENVTEIPSSARDRGPRPPRPPDSSEEPRTPLGPVERAPDGEGGPERRFRRFGMGRRGDLQIFLPGQNPLARRSDRLVQGIADCFVVDTDIERILVVQHDGRIAATASIAGSAPGPSDSEIAASCQRFLSDGNKPFQLEVFGSHVGVINPLKDPMGEKPRGLYVQYHKASVFELLGYRLVYVGLLGAGMIAIGILMSIRISRRLSEPVHALVRCVREFGGGNLSHRINLKTGDEFQTLGEAFDQMAGSVQAYTRQLESETKRRESLESELRIAADLQQSLLPEKPPRISGLDLAGWSQPAAQVGGDFFDYLDFGNNRIGVMIGDATGKGLPAALLTNECWSVLRAFAQGSTSPADLLFKTNNALWKRLGDSGQFVTLFLMLIDMSQGSLRYSVAGHNPPFLLSSSPSRERLLSSRVGFPLGLFEDCAYEDIDVPLNPSDTILMYSDGLTDAPGRGNRRYGDERLRSVLATSIGMPLPDVIASIRHDLNTHTRGAEVRDDVTIVGARFNARVS